MADWINMDELKRLYIELMEDPFTYDEETDLITEKKQFKKKQDAYSPEECIQRGLLFITKQIEIANFYTMSRAQYKALDAKQEFITHTNNFKQMPKVQLIEIGMDLSLYDIRDKKIPLFIKWLKNDIMLGGWPNPRHDRMNLLKGKQFVLQIPDNGILPLSLYEFPETSNFRSSGITAKTDLILLLDPWEPEQPELVETVYNLHGIKLMKKFDIKDAKTLLDKRRTIFTNAPTATNTILIFQLMDAIILNDFKTGVLDLDAGGEKNLVRLEKLKNLALSTKFNEERKSAVDKCFFQFELVNQKNIAAPGDKKDVKP